MVVKNIKYTDYDGNEREEKFYFNINKPELTKIRYSVDGGFENYIDRITKAVDVKEILEVFDLIMDVAYCEKSDDGRVLKKSKELSEAFKQSAAYESLFEELIEDPSKAAAFINAILPKDVMDKAKELKTEQ